MAKFSLAYVYRKKTHLCREDHQKWNGQGTLLSILPPGESLRLVLVTYGTKSERVLCEAGIMSGIGVFCAQCNTGDQTRTLRAAEFYSLVLFRTWEIAPLRENRDVKIAGGSRFSKTAVNVFGFEFGSRLQFFGPWWCLAITKQTRLQGLFGQTSTCSAHCIVPPSLR